MIPETPDTKPEPIEYTHHWAQWWLITLIRLLNAPSGTHERKKAYELHQQAKGNLSHSLGFSGEVDHGR